MNYISERRRCIVQLDVALEFCTIEKKKHAVTQIVMVVINMASTRYFCAKKLQYKNEGHGPKQLLHPKS